MSSFRPAADLLDARAAVRRAVDVVLDRIEQGALPDAVELEHVDLKEEAGRRGRGGEVAAGRATNTAAAAHLADEVACFSNTPGGGALVVGVENRSGDLIGTALDHEWLRHAIYTRVDIAPAIEERHVHGVRLLVLLVGPSAEPVEDTSGRLRWRVGQHCVPVDRAEWWLDRQQRTGVDSMAAVTSRTIDDVSAGALGAARRLARSAGDEESADAPAPEFLQRLGVLRPDGLLTQAGALVFCPADRTHLELSALDVEGGDVLLSPPDLRGLSLLEQVTSVEERLEALNTEIVLPVGFAQPSVRRLPPSAVREAVLNGLAHREWMSPEPVVVTWVQADSALQVVSPGGFAGGVTAETVLTQRFARHPALADLFRALRLVEKQGLGVDRMYREMVGRGHRPPLIVEETGPRVRTRLVGGRPVAPVMALTSAIEPAARRRDVRVALIVDELLRRPLVTAARMSVVLQRSVDEAAEALDAAAECRVRSSLLIVRFKGGWVLSDDALALVERNGTVDERRARGILLYRRPEDGGVLVVRSWFSDHDRITTGDYATLTGMTKAGALKHLTRLVEDGLLVRGDEMGRNAHFRPGPRWSGA